MSSIGDLTLDIKVGGDTKTLDATIAKVKTLNDQVVSLNKNLKGTDKGFNLKTGNGGSSRSGSVKDLTEDQVARKKLSLARSEFGFVRLKAQQENLDYTKMKRERFEKERAEKIEVKQEKERRKDRDKDAKKFFSTLQNGFEKTAKFGLGVLTGGAGIAGAAFLAGKQATSIANLGVQQGLSSQDVQKWRNVLTQANPNLSGDQALGIIGNLQSTLAKQAISGESAGSLMALGLDPSERSAIRVLQALREKEFASPDIKTQLLGNLGVDAAAANALNRSSFDETAFLKASSMPTLTDKEVRANEDFARSVNQFKNIIAVFSGKVLAELAPILDRIAQVLANPSDPHSQRNIAEAKKKATQAGAVVGAVSLGMFKSPVFAGMAGSSAAAYVAAEELGKTPEERAEEDRRRIDFGEKSFLGGLFKVRRTGVIQGAQPLPDHLRAEELRFNRAEADKFKDVIASQYSGPGLTSMSGSGSKSVLIQPTVNNNFNVGEINSANLPTIQRGIENSSNVVNRSMVNSMNQPGANY